MIPSLTNQELEAAIQAIRHGLKFGRFPRGPQKAFACKALSKLKTQHALQTSIIL